MNVPIGRGQALGVVLLLGLLVFAAARWRRHPPTLTAGRGAFVEDARPRSRSGRRRQRWHRRATRARLMRRRRR